MWKWPNPPKDSIIETLKDIIADQANKILSKATDASIYALEIYVHAYELRMEAMGIC